jgi:hypothetical protein
MTVKVTLCAGGTDQFMRFGDVYIKHHDGTLDVVRGGAKHTHHYAPEEWADVEGDQKKFTKRFWG